MLAFELGTSYNTLTMKVKKNKMSVATETLAETLRLHKLWLEDDPYGKRANLRDADLRDANLYGVILDGAELKSTRF